MKTVKTEAGKIALTSIVGVWRAPDAVFVRHEDGRLLRVTEDVDVRLLSQALKGGR